MPINRTLMRKLIKQYGLEKAKEVYYAMENEGKSSFKKGLKTAKKEGHTQKHFTRKRKKK